MARIHRSHEAIPARLHQVNVGAARTGVRRLSLLLIAVVLQANCIEARHASAVHVTQVDVKGYVAALHVGFESVLLAVPFSVFEHQIVVVSDVDVVFFVAIRHRGEVERSDVFIWIAAIDFDFEQIKGRGLILCRCKRCCQSRQNE